MYNKHVNMLHHFNQTNFLKSSIRRLGILFAIGIAALSSQADAVGWTGFTLQNVKCDGRQQSFGPWDFYDVNEESDPLWMEGRWWEVKTIHADPGIRYMQEDPMNQISYNRAAAEFDYVLRAFPNHPEILNAVIELEMRRRRARGKVSPYSTPPECYLQRAAMWRPGQPHIKQLMGLYMHRLGRPEDAIDHYKAALALDSNMSEVHYNLGLAYFANDEFPNAVQHAREAYRLGYPLPGLRRKLMRKGVWPQQSEASNK